MELSGASAFEYQVAVQERMRMKNRCYSTIVGYDTMGSPIFARKCFCGTTACLNKMDTRQFKNHLSITTVQQERTGELSPEEEKAFYRKAFG
jgi:hypothetical protein